MPYINMEDRVRLDEYDVGGAFDHLTAGELTYVLYRILLNALPPNFRYTDLHRVLGATEAAKLEFYRQQVAPYEDDKIQTNGPIV
jgi:hypothetical protein